MSALTVTSEREQLLEDKVLACIFLDNSLIDECPLCSSQFQSFRGKLLFSAMEKLAEDAEDEAPINPVSVSQALGDENLKQIGGLDFLVKLSDSMPTAAEFDYYCREINENWIIHEGSALMRKSLLHLSKEGISDTTAKLEKLLENKHSDDRTTEEVMIDLYEFLTTNQKGLRGVTTGSADLDGLTGGMQAGNLIILAAQTTMGKTAFAVNMALCAAKHGARVDFFETEMSKDELISRMVSNLATLDMMEWHKNLHRLTQKDLNRVSAAMTQISKLKININDDAGMAVNDIRSAIRRSMKNDPNSKHLVIIDYLQQVNPAIRNPQRRDLEIGSITRYLKQTARKFNVPIVLVSQLSRGVNHRDDKRPVMSDLRDSGNIEQDADVILFLYRENYYKHNIDNNNIEIIIAKQRNGPTGKVYMECNLTYQQFSNNYLN